MKNIIKSLCCILLAAACIGTSETLAQSPGWSLFQRNETALGQFMPAVKKDQQEFFARYPKTDQPYAKPFYDERETAIASLVDQQALVTDPRVDTYLQKLTGILMQAQPALRAKPLRIYFSRDFVPNACSYGEGTILFNIGLFARLHNEGEAAFVLAHEIGHYVLGHADQRVRKYISTIYSDSMQRVLRNLQKQEYGKSAILDSLLKQQAHSFSRHSRENESQADSFALALLLQTPFAPAAAQSCLGLLDSIDTDHFREPLAVQQIFNYPDYPFKARWLRKEESIFADKAGAAPKADDSLKTHPDCQQRIHAIDGWVRQGKGQQFFLVDSAYFRALQRSMDLDMAGYAYTSGNVSRALFYALNLCQVYPEEQFPVELAGQCLNDLYEAMKRHELRKICALPGLQTEGAYDAFVVFLENLRPYDMAALTYYYHQRYGTLAATDQRFAQSKKKSEEIYSQLKLQQQP